MSQSNKMVLALDVSDMTVEAFGRHYMIGVQTVCGPPAKVADALEALHEATGRNGGFILHNKTRPAPGFLADFVDHVVPELQRRGLTRTRYDGSTLRQRIVG